VFTTHEVVDEGVDSAVSVAQPVRNHGDCYGRVVLWNAGCVSVNENSFRLIQPDSRDYLESNLNDNVGCALELVKSTQVFICLVSTKFASAALHMCCSAQK
jgi:hypothetical protein